MIIVTGGAGFIGSNLVKALNDRGLSQIIVVDNLSNSAKHLNLNRLKIADYIDKRDFLPMLNNFKNVQTIFHLGACSNTMETDGQYMMKNNYEYSRELLNFSLRNKVDFIYASSASVYGNGSNGFREDITCEYPLNVYAYSKFLFDQYVREILQNNTSSSSQILGLRYFNVFGPQENHKGKMASVAYHLMTQIKNGESMKIFTGSENFKRDFIYVEDAVAMNLHFYESKQSGIYNCGTGKSRSFTDIAKILQALSDGSQVENVPFPDALKNKYQAFTEADLTQARKAGFTKPFLSLEDSLKKYYQLFAKTGGFLE